jgi:hypothetical protein
MPTNPPSPAVRVSTGFLDTVNDDFPGGGSSAPGFAYGQRGAKVSIGIDGPVSISNSSNRYEGSYQYVQTLSTDSVAPLLGTLAFWSDRANYVVSTAVSTAGVENLAGIFLGGLPAGGKWGFIKIPEGGGRTLVNFSGTTPAAGQIAQAQTGSNIAVTVAAGTDIKGYSFGVVQGAKSVGDNAVVALRAPGYQS